MKQYYRSRIICGAMLAFLIVMAFAVAGIFYFSYRQIEQESTDFLQAMLSTGEERQSFSQPAPPPMFGYTPNDRSVPSGFYDITMDEDGNVLTIEQRGIAEDAVVSVQQYVQQAVKSSKDSGKVGSYKYAMVRNDDDTVHMILLDISIQLQGLYHMMRSAAMVVAALMVLLFLILLPVSSKVADAFVRNGEAQKRFMTDASHELKTPVAIIRANLDTMELLESKSKWSSNIRCQVDRLEKLIGQLLMMARLEECETGRSKAEVDLSALIRRQWENYAPAMTQRNLAPSLMVQDGLTLRGWENPLEQMLALLMDNGVQYVNEGGTLSLSAEAKGRRILLRMDNTVEHLPAQSPQMLTARFARGSTARTQSAGGAGIGLSAVERIVQMHGGQLTITYPDDHAFRVSVELPK